APGHLADAETTGAHEGHEALAVSVLVDAALPPAGGALAPGELDRGREDGERRHLDLLDDCRAHPGRPRSRPKNDSRDVNTAPARGARRPQASGSPSSAPGSSPWATCASARTTWTQSASPTATWTWLPSSSSKARVQCGMTPSGVACGGVTETPTTFGASAQNMPLGRPPDCGSHATPSIAWRYGSACVKAVIMFSASVAPMGS